MMIKQFKILKFKFSLFCLICLVGLTTSCGIYSFTGASISPEVKTISIATFPNNAQIVKPTLSAQLTEAIKDRFATQTSLKIVPSGGDLSLEGSIVSYTTLPTAIQGTATAQAALNRLTVSIRVKFINYLDDKQNFEANFSRYQDYPSSQNLSAVEDNLVKQIIDALVDDIFNRAVVNW